MNQARYFTWVSLFAIVVFLMGCTADSLSTGQPIASSTLQPVIGRDLQIVTGQEVYIPAYSEVFAGRQGMNTRLAITLAIHNTDPDSPIIIQTVRYYDTNGTLVRNYIDEPVEVSPLATTGFLVEETDDSGGWGSNFIVEWVAENPVYEPIIEAIMISTRSAQGISMISTGRVISQTGSTRATTD
ncbi:MAG: DUF3124 domain-containing protein [Anaerolineae bacterium]|nr:DUF3124 domain-containing protein [Anaerolineae bacterium]MCA9889860.1 DUF3124 domain-containing protein [Anaerolineae bacterium]